MSDDREITEGSPANSSGRQFKGIDGNPVTLLQLIRDEPEWALSRIVHLEHEIAEWKHVATELRDARERCICPLGWDSACPIHHN